MHDLRGFKCAAIEERAEEVFQEMREEWGENGCELAGKHAGIHERRLDVMFVTECC